MLVLYELSLALFTSSSVPLVLLVLLQHCIVFHQLLHVAQGSSPVDIVVKVAQIKYKAQAMMTLQQMQTIPDTRTIPKPKPGQDSKAHLVYMYIYIVMCSINQYLGPNSKSVQESLCNARNMNVQYRATSSRAPLTHGYMQLTHGCCMDPIFRVQHRFVNNATVSQFPLHQVNAMERRQTM